MKKQYTFAVLALSATLALAGCSWSDVKSKLVGDVAATVSSSAVSGDSVVVVEDYDPNQCVTLAEYKGVEVDCSVTDDDVEKEVQTLLQNYGKTEDVKDGTAQKWYTVTVDYVGKVDGKEFDKGSAEDAQITLGMGNYIEDLENGIIGMKIGETKDVSVKFPENYGESTLAGKDAVFTVTLNSMTKIKTEFNDKFVKKNSGDYSTVDEFKKGKREELAQSKKSSATSTALQTVIDGSTINSMPATLVEAQKKQMDHYYRYQFSMYYGDEDFQTILTQMGTTMEDYDKQLDSSAEANAKIILVVEAIAAKENITVDQEALDRYISANVAAASASGIGSFDEYRDQYYTVYGQAISFEDFSRTSYLYEKVMDVIEGSLVMKE